MNPHLLHSVVDDLLTTIEHRPELEESVMRFVFDEGHAIREGLIEGCKRTMDVPNVLAGRELIQFAHAIANGVVPDMPLRGGGPAG